MTDDELEGMYINFTSFKKTYEMLYSKLNDDTFNVYGIPCIVNGAFACEIGLKYLLNRKNICYGKTHFLHKLLELLPTDLKDDIYNYLRIHGLHYTDTSINKNIIYVTNLFEDFRYAFERDLCILEPFTYIFFDSIFQLVEKNPAPKTCFKELTEDEIDDYIKRCKIELDERIAKKVKKNEIQL